MFQSAPTKMSEKKKQVLEKSQTGRKSSKHTVSVFQLWALQCFTCWPCSVSPVGLAVFHLWASQCFTCGPCSVSPVGLAVFHLLALQCVTCGPCSVSPVGLAVCNLWASQCLTCGLGGPGWEQLIINTLQRKHRCDRGSDTLCI